MKNLFLIAFILLFVGVETAQAEKSFAVGDGIAMTLGGSSRFGFVYAENIDLDSTQLPGALNYVNTRLRLEPGLWINEVVQFHSGVDLIPDRNWGDGGPWWPQLQWGYLQLVTPVGRIRIGRQTRQFGLGLAFEEGRDEETAYGFLHEVPVEDRIEWKAGMYLGPLPVEGSLAFGILHEPQDWMAPVYGEDDLVRFAIRFGLRERNDRKAELQFLYDARGHDSIHRYDLSIFGEVVLARYLRVGLEAGMVQGSTEGYMVFDSVDGYSQPALALEGYRARFDLSAENAKLSGGIDFSGSRLTALFATGPDDAAPWKSGRLKMSGSSVSACQCLIAGQHALPALRDSWKQRMMAALPKAANQSAADSIEKVYGSIGSLDGFWGAQAHAVLRYKDLTTTLSGIFLRSLYPTASRQLLAANTSAVDDDEYVLEQNALFELDLKVSYTFMESLDLALDAGILFPNELMFVSGADQGPTLLVMPRLTVSF